MAKAITIIEIDHGNEDPASVAKRVALAENMGREEAQNLSNILGNLQGADLRVRVDSSEGVAAQLLINVTGTGITSGESFGIVAPQGVWSLSAVGTGAVTGSGTFNTSSNNTTVATNIATAVNSLNGLRSVVSASGGAGTVTFTSLTKGTIGNSLFISNNAGTGISGSGLISGSGYFSGGKDASTRLSGSVTCVSSSVNPDDWMQLGSVRFVAKASGATGNVNFNIGASSTAMATNLGEKINAHPDLSGIVSCTTSSGVLTLSYACDPRAAKLIGLSTNNTSSFVLIQPTAETTLSGVLATRAYNLGG